MIKHIVLFKFKEGVDKIAEKRVLKDKLKALPRLIPTIRSIEIGDNMMDSARSWDFHLFLYLILLKVLISTAHIQNT